MEVIMEKSATSQVVIIGFFLTTHNYLAVSKASYKIRMSKKYNLPMATHSAVNSPNKYVCISHLEFSSRRILHPALYDWCISGRRGIALLVILVSRGSVCSHLPGRIPSLVGKIGSNICKNVPNVPVILCYYNNCQASNLWYSYFCISNYAFIY